jgi:hypothetical protein
MTSDSATPDPRSKTPNQTSSRSKSRLSFLTAGVRGVLRGEISAPRAALEVLRRTRVKLSSRQERALIEQLRNKPAQLTSEFRSLSPAALLEHFRQRRTPSFFPGFENVSVSETEDLVEAATRIVNEHRWPLLGFGVKDFGKEIDWLRDPLSGREWPANVFHSDIPVWHNDGSDVRVLWELNRMGHCLTLAQAYAVTRNEKLAEECLGQIESWYAQNPLGLGANWMCAMEVALRSMNLLGVFTLLRDSASFTEQRLLLLLALFEQHGAHVRRNLEFSYVSTGDHYLSDVVGLLWLALMLPELQASKDWREWAFRELLREMDKQVLPDGTNFESSTGYHRLVLELFLYSFILCKTNDLRIEEKYWKKLRDMLWYVRCYLRPDGAAPLLGDTDSGQAFQLVRRRADDHAYVLAIGAAIFGDGKLKPANLNSSPEVAWLLGDTQLPATAVELQSEAFPDTGTYLLRQDDLYLAFNASGAGGNGRGSHGHNDALSIDVSASGTPFIVDPGSYVYTADLDQRHLFRSTAYHCTLQIDDVEQNTTNASVPFVIGDEAHPKVLRWETTSERDVLIAEHHGYKRLSAPVVHRRSVVFEKQLRCWFVDDELLGNGNHLVAARFHCNPGLRVDLERPNLAVLTDPSSRARLLIVAFDFPGYGALESNFVSRDYGSKEPSVSLNWSNRIDCPAKFSWAIVVINQKDDVQERLDAVSNSRN